MSDSILVVVPCLNEEAHLERVAEGVLAPNRDLALQLVIVDGGSTDRTPEIARRLAGRDARVRLLDNPRRIQAAAVNRAVAELGGDATYLIRLDAHADYPPDFCRVLVDEAQRTGADSVVVAMTTVGEKAFQRAVAAAQNSRLGNGGSAHRTGSREGRWVEHGHHALMRLQAFRAAGGYDETFSHNEDAELDARLTAAGHRIWLSARTGVLYFPRSAPLPLFRQYLKHGRGRARNILKHHRWPRWRQLAPAAVVPAALLAMLAPWNGVTLLPLAAWAVFCVAYGLALGIGARDPRLALSGPAAMIMHAGWSLGFWRALLVDSWKPA